MVRFVRGAIVIVNAQQKKTAVTFLVHSHYDIVSVIFVHIVLVQCAWYTLSLCECCWKLIPGCCNGCCYHVVVQVNAQQRQR